MKAWILSVLGYKVVEIEKETEEVKNHGNKKEKGLGQKSSSRKKRPKE